MWGAFSTTMNTFYAAAARSMSMSWKNFLFGSLDPAGSITIDKLWGFLWPQALSARIFGFHAWSLALPVALEGIVTVLVLYRAVRRWAGPAAGLLAAAIFTLTPVVTASFGRSGLEDTALTMCLVLAADAWQSAMLDDRPRSLLLAAFWVGAAFQTKMVQAWAVLPVLLLVYLCCAAGPLTRRLWHTLGAAALAAAVSLSLLAVVQLTPAADRPYVDGSSGGSVFRMVFGYNFADRFGSRSSAAASGLSGWGKLFGVDEPGFASQIGWLYPLAGLALIVGIVVRGRRPRTDAARAGYLMWGGSLVLTGLAFSAASIPHSQYTLALAPDIAALSAAGLVLFTRLFRERHPLGWTLVAAVAATLAWTGYVSAGYSGFVPWLTPVVLAVGIGGIAALLLGRLPRRARPWLTTAGLVAAVTALLGTSAAWAVSTVDSDYDGSGVGAAAGPYGQVAAAAQAKLLAPLGPRFVAHGTLTPAGEAFAQGELTRFAGDGTLSPADAAVLRYLQEHQDGARYLAAVTPSPAAGAFVIAAGASVLPMGGFDGTEPFPSLGAFQHLVATGQVRYVLSPPFFGPPFAPPGVPWISQWVSTHCTAVTVPGFSTAPVAGAGTPNGVPTAGTGPGAGAGAGPGAGSGAGANAGAGAGPGAGSNGGASSGPGAGANAGPGAGANAGPGVGPGLGAGGAMGGGSLYRCGAGAPAGE